MYNNRHWASDVIDRRGDRYLRRPQGGALQRLALRATASTASSSPARSSPDAERRSRVAARRCCPRRSLGLRLSDRRPVTRTKSGIFILAPINGPVGERIAQVQAEYDPQLARLGPPHVTLAGSSGMGPIAPAPRWTSCATLSAPIAEQTAPIELQFGRRRGSCRRRSSCSRSIRTVRCARCTSAIKTSGLRAAAPRFYFTPHVTLSLYREQPREAMRALLRRCASTSRRRSIRSSVHLTRDTGESRELLTLVAQRQVNVRRYFVRRSRTQGADHSEEWLAFSASRPLKDTAGEDRADKT